jgi:hypothetical protein
MGNLAKKAMQSIASTMTEVFDNANQNTILGIGDADFTLGFRRHTIRRKNLPSVKGISRKNPSIVLLARSEGAVYTLDGVTPLPVGEAVPAGQWCNVRPAEGSEAAWTSQVDPMIARRLGFAELLDACNAALSGRAVAGETSKAGLQIGPTAAEPAAPASPVAEPAAAMSPELLQQFQQFQQFMAMQNQS